MSAADVLLKLGESLGASATVKSVFGEPIQVGAKTIVPVAKVAYGFGGGFGAGKKAVDVDAKGEGGGGGGMRAYPAGVFEITDTGTRFVPYVDVRMLAAVFGGALTAAFILARRR